MHTKILWADDEIDLLKPHILFLEDKGYQVTTVNNGSEAVDQVQEQSFDVIFLDENMPGITGLEALTEIKKIKPHTPVIMITKSEEESIMEEAIGGKIADYLIKPLNPNQILLSLKKNLDQKRIISETTTSKYQQEFRQLSMKLNDRLDWEDWVSVYNELTDWEMKLQDSDDEGIQDILRMQKSEATSQFSRYIENHYAEWLNDEEEGPLMSQNVMSNRVFPELKENKVCLIVIDNLRHDQWKIIEPLISDWYQKTNEKMFSSILPTATHYARNALFAGLMPEEIQRRYPDHWKNENDEGSKNKHEDHFLSELMKRRGMDQKMTYHKITNLEKGKKLIDRFHDLKHNDFIVLVYNFVDMLSHARTDMEVIRELAEDDAAYRSLTKSWFEHSPLREIIKMFHDEDYTLMITTDHGTINVNTPVKIVGDKNTNTNLRYKLGRSLSYNENEVYTLTPEEAKLPKTSINDRYVFAKDDQYFVYPNNYNHFVKFYNNTFQHGGISMEEMIVPIITLKPKK